MKDTIIMQGIRHELEVYRLLHDCGHPLELTPNSGRHQPMAKFDLSVAGYAVEVKFRRTPLRMLVRWLRHADLIWFRSPAAEDMVVMTAAAFIALLRPKEETDGPHDPQVQ